MRKKFLAAILATSLVLTMAPVMPAPTGIAGVASAEETAETLTGTAWWKADNQKGKDYILSGDGTLDLYIGYTKEVAEGAAFCVELLSDGNKYITTASDTNIWTGEEGKGDVSGAHDPLASNLVLGHKYKITVTRTGSDFTILYYDMTDNKEYCSLAAKNTNMGTDVAVHVMAEIGTYTVSTSDFDMPASGTPGTPGATTAPTDAPAASGTPETPGATTAPTDAPATPGDTTGSTTPDGAVTSLVCGAFWGAHTPGITVGTEGVTIKFKNKSDADAINNWETPVYVIYSGDEPVVNGAGYTEYGVMRSDNFGWKNPDRPETVVWAADTSIDMLAFDWAGWIDANKTGADYEVSAIRKDNTVYMRITAGNLVTYGAIQVEEGKDAYLSLTGEKCTLTDIATADYSSFEVPAALTSAGTDTDIGGDTPGDSEPDDGDDDKPAAKKTMKVSGIVAKANTKKITGKISVSNAKVTVKVGSAKFKAAKVNGKKFTFTTTKLKKGTKIKIKATKSGYKNVTKSVKVK